MVGSCEATGSKTGIVSDNGGGGVGGGVWGGGGRWVEKLKMENKERERKTIIK